MWVLRLVAVDVVILTLWMIVDGPHTAMTIDVYGYAGELAPPAPFFALLSPIPRFKNTARYIPLEIISRCKQVPVVSIAGT